MRPCRAMVVLFALVLSAACSDTATVDSADAFDVTETADTDLPSDATAATDAPADAVDTSEPTDTPLDPCPGGAGCPCANDFDCDDGDPCTWGASCVDGFCSKGFQESCDDGNGCTTDTCLKVGGCENTLQNGACQDGDPCTVGDLCVDGACVAGKPRVCADGNGCTDDVCQPGQGCAYIHNKAPCADGNACLEPSNCEYGYCPPGDDKPCDDGQTCTYDTCDPVKGCEPRPEPAPQACSGSEQFGRCFEAFGGKVTWTQARAACQAWDGELVSIHNKYENKYVRELATAECGVQALWIGATDRAHEGVWRWSNAKKGGFQDWAGGEPNDAGGNEDFAEMYDSGVWNDVPDIELGCYVCARATATPCDDNKACEVGAICGGGKCQPPTSPRDCNDGNPCTLDGCEVGLACAHTVVDDGTGCGLADQNLAGTCKSAICQINQVTPVASCATMLAAHPTAPTGVYTLDPDGAGPIEPYAAYCDMHADGGGWTLVLKVDGTDKEAGFTSTLWTEAKPLNAQAILPDSQQAKLPGFWTLPTQQVRVAMRTGKPEDKAGVVERWLTLPAVGTSLRDLFAADKPVPTQLGLVAWKSLMPKPSLQANCHAEGLNASGGGTRVRIGILGNNEDDCATPDSWLGLGGTPGICGNPGLPTSGNLACYLTDNGYADSAAVGWVFVR
ncbi:MAG: fibrinogen-like YCDxxxxGGGW domain-containing protein [Myxococcota bacterium]